MIGTHTWRETRPYWAWWGTGRHEAALKQRFADRCIRNEWFWDEDDAIKNLLPWNLPADGIAWPLKAQVQAAIRRSKAHKNEPFPGVFPSIPTSHEKQFRHFNAALESEITAFVQGLGITLSHDDFAPRDGRELEAAISQGVAA
jgi:hypothetical protein